MLRLVDIAKSFGDRVVLRPMSMEIPVGKTTALLGPSGCGKSTLLRIVAGLILPDQGQVFFDNEEVTPRTLRQIRQKMGFVLQDGGLFPHLTARENTGLLAKHLGWDVPKVSDRVEELAALTRLPRDVLSRFRTRCPAGSDNELALCEH